jgi:hypothetical protein
MSGIVGTNVGYAVDLGSKYAVGLVVGFGVATTQKFAIWIKSAWESALQPPDISSDL